MNGDQGPGAGDQGPAIGPLEVRIGHILGLATELAAARPVWQSFYGAILGRTGAMRRLLEVREIYQDLGGFPEMDRVLRLLARLRERSTYSGLIHVETIRIPEALHDSLLLEVAELGTLGVSTSINQLAISKLIRPIRADQVPDKRRGRGRSGPPLAVAGRIAPADPDPPRAA